MIRRNILGMLRLALIPASPDARGAQHDKSEMISEKRITIFDVVEIQTDSLPKTADDCQRSPKVTVVPQLFNLDFLAILALLAMPRSVRSTANLKPL